MRYRLIAVRSATSLVPIVGEPDDGGAVAARGEREAAVGREADRGDFLRVAGERKDFLAAVSVRASHSLTVLSWLPVSTRLPSGEKATDVTAAVWPASLTSCSPVLASQMIGRVVLAAGDHEPAVGREVAAEHGPIVACERQLAACAGLPIPDPGGLVAAGGEHARAIGRKRRAEHAVRVAAEHDAVGLPVCDVPQAGRAVVAGGEHFAAVGRELDRVDVAGVAASSLRIAWPVAASQILAEWSQLPVTKSLPSGERAAEATAPCGLNRTTGRRVSRFHSSASLPPIVSTCWPSRANIAAQTTPPSLLKSSTVSSGIALAIAGGTPRVAATDSSDSTLRSSRRGDQRRCGRRARS